MKKISFIFFLIGFVFFQKNLSGNIQVLSQTIKPVSILNLKSLSINKCTASFGKLVSVNESIIACDDDQDTKNKIHFQQLILYPVFNFIAFQKTGLPLCFVFCIKKPTPRIFILNSVFRI